MGGRKLRVGIVGGNATRAWAHDAHVPALRKMADRFEIEAVSARSLDLAEEARAAFCGKRAFGDSLELVRDPDVDIVAVTVKVPEHRAIVLAALEAGKHVYCEWPLGRDLAEAEEMAAAVTAASHVAIGLQALSAPAVRHAAKLVREGALGDPLVARIFSPTAGWGASAPAFYAYLQDKRNGATLETIAGGHTLAMIEHVVGAYRELDARTTITHKHLPITGTDDVIERTCADHMLVLGRHEGGCVSTLEVTGGVADKPFGFELVGTKGSLRLTSSFPGGFQGGAITLETTVEAKPAPQQSIESLRMAAINVSEVWLRLASDIATGERTVPDFAYAVRLSRLLDAIDRASETGTRQRLD